MDGAVARRSLGGGIGSGRVGRRRGAVAGGQYGQRQRGGQGGAETGGGRGRAGEDAHAGSSSDRWSARVPGRLAAVTGAEACQKWQRCQPEAAVRPVRAPAPLRRRAPRRTGNRCAKRRAGGQLPRLERWQRPAGGPPGNDRDLLHRSSPFAAPRAARGAVTRPPEAETRHRPRAANAHRPRLPASEAEATLSIIGASCGQPRHSP